MPHLDFATFPGQVFWLFISFAALYFIVSRIILPRVDVVLENRDKHIAGNLTKAEQLRATAEEAEKKLAKLMQQAAEEARTELGQSVALAEKQSAARKAELSVRMDKKIAESEKKIAAIETAAELMVEKISVEISEVMVKKVLEAA